MKLAVAQFGPEFGNLDRNMDIMINFCKKDDYDIIVFPELALTGYDFENRTEVQKYSYERESDYLSFFKNYSINNNKIIVVGFAEKIKDKYYNSAALFFPDAKLNCSYHKTHLFFRERLMFDENEKGFFNVYYGDMDINIGTMICYDWRFPEAARTLALKGADLIVCPSNLVTTVWDISMPSRALENKVYLALSNRTGIENRNHEELVFNGQSKIYAYNGKVMAEASYSEDELITSEINPAETRSKSFNKYNDIFIDRRPKFYL